MEETIQVACAIIIEHGRILAAQRNKEMTFPLKWEFPGGKIKPGESAEECLHRELREELEITIFIEEKLESTLYSNGDFRITLIPFIARCKKGKINLTEHRDAKWLNKEDMKKLDWAPADRPIVNLILKSDYI